MSRRRDPRWDPRPGDVLEDDPPLDSLRVEEAHADGVGRVACRNASAAGIPRRWEGSLTEWRREMRDAEVRARGED